MDGPRTFTLQADARGRMLLPREVRAAAGFGPGSTIRVELAADDTVKLINPAAERRRAIQAARGAMAGSGGTVDELIATRRAERRREQR